MATLLDTSALALFIRRTRPATLEVVARATREELEAGRVLVSAVTAVELLVGARGERGSHRLVALLEALPVVVADREVSMHAGHMGAHARAHGATIPVPDLLIAATAVWLDVPLLTCDSDFVRGRQTGIARKARSSREDDGGSLWSRLRLHPASAAR
jgi:predicted nucleic acid-binding protein